MSKRTLPFVLVLAALLISPALAAAQEMDPAAQERMMRHATPAKEHEALGKMVGEWKTTITFHEGDHSISQEGVTIYEWSLGGRYIVGTFETEIMGQPFLGRSTDGYDIGNGKYVSTWMDTMSTGIMYSEGGANPGGWQVTFKGNAYNHMLDADVTYETVRTMKEEDTFTVQMFLLGHQGEKTLNMEILYERRES